MIPLEEEFYSLSFISSLFLLNLLLFPYIVTSRLFSLPYFYPLHIPVLYVLALRAEEECEITARDSDAPFVVYVDCNNTSVLHRQH